ncbi:MAG: DUF1254 domain-containing protein [Actinomycetes bacterium]
MRKFGAHAALVGMVLLAIAACSTASPSGVSTTSADYQRGYQIGLEAYTYGLPLLTTDATFRTMTSVNVSQGAYGPVNQFNNVRSANTSSSTAVVAPGSTSLSSIAWLDLRDGPLVLHVPQVTGHYFVLAFIDPYTNNTVNLGTASSTAPGDYVIEGPQQRSVTLPAGTHALPVDYWRMWIIGSTQLTGPSDVAAVNAIQDQYTLTPLAKYGTADAPTTPTPTPTNSTVTKYTPSTGLAFFDELGGQLSRFPPPTADAPALARFATVGIGPGKSPSTDTSLSAATQQGLTDAVAAGPAQIHQETQTLFAQDFDTHNGYLLGGFGTYGTNYTERAVISQIGLGAFVAHQAIYAMSWSDSAKTPLSGSSAYVLHLTNAPPTNEGWSLTVYSLHGTLMPNSLGRYSFTNTSPLTRNSDGSIDILLQSTTPATAAQQANWLPLVAGQGFEVAWRLFAPAPQSINGILDGSLWQPPTITLATAS